MTLYAVAAANDADARLECLEQKHFIEHLLCSSVFLARSTFVPTVSLLGNLCSIRLDFMDRMYLARQKASERSIQSIYF